MNKYNIRAIRNDLDSLIQSGSWNKFRLQFNAVSKNVELVKAVVEYRSKKKGDRSRTTSSYNDGTLLHSICQRYSNPPVDVIESIVSVVPQTVQMQDSRGCAPLHVTLGSHSSSSSIQLVECLLKHDVTTQTLTMTNHDGDTPLLLAARKNPTLDILEMLVRADLSKKSLLMTSRKQRRTPLWYVAGNEWYAMSNDVMETLQFMIELTCLALLSLDGRDIPSRFDRIRTNDPLDENGHGDDCLLQATLKCSHLLRRYSRKIIQIILE